MVIVIDLQTIIMGLAAGLLCAGLTLYAINATDKWCARPGGFDDQQRAIQAKRKMTQ
jgi:hypothetical protein